MKDHITSEKEIRHLSYQLQIMCGLYMKDKKKNEWTGTEINGRNKCGEGEKCNEF